MNPVYIFQSLRTPRGNAKLNGALRRVKPHALITTLLEHLVVSTPVEPELIEDFILGCVTPIGDQGYNITQASLMAANWPETIGAAQVNRYCASGLESIHMAAARIAAGWDNAILAGGVEMMGTVPLGSDGGVLLQDPELILNAASIPQGVAADLMATYFKFSRLALDEYSFRSQQRAVSAIENGYFEGSIVPVRDQNGIVLLAKDELPRKGTSLELIQKLSPAFEKIGSEGFDAIALEKYPEIQEIYHLHTAGNSSALSDGASITLLGNENFSQQNGLEPVAQIISIAVASSDPTMMLKGMIPATEKALEKTNMTINDIDLIEVNEAFATVPLVFMQYFDCDPDKVNVNGGAIALGHPVGATGSILVSTLIDELKRRNKRRGLVTLCAGGGQGIAAIIEIC